MYVDKYCVASLRKIINRTIYIYSTHIYLVLKLIKFFIFEIFGFTRASCYNSNCNKH